MTPFFQAVFQNLRTWLTAGIVNAWEGAQTDAAKIIRERSELPLAHPDVDVIEPPEPLLLDELVIE